jgi:universal stress protein A
MPAEVGMISMILVALDHTVRARGVLRAATEVADRFDARMVLFRAIAIEQTFPPSASTATHRDLLPAYLEMEALNELDELSKGNARAKRTPPIIAIGPPAKTIVDTANQIGADLIVLGSHGLHGLDYLFGTTTGSIATRARCSVFVVHEA